MPTDPSVPGLRPFQPPPQMHRNLALARRWFRPLMMGLDALDLRRPALFVGNHTLFGISDVPLLVDHLYTHHGIMLRALGDRGHFRIPAWRDVLVAHGMVLGTPENCAELMRSGQHVLVFPGGGREVMRRKGECYRLIWKRRAGFARMAMEHGYDIIPFGALGADESYRILLDANDLMATAAWRWLSRHTGLPALTRDGDMIPPLVRGIGPSLLPRPQRYYFGFGARIPAAQGGERQPSPEQVWRLREQVARAVEQQIDQLLAYRREDRLRNWSPLRRWLAPVQVCDAPLSSHSQPGFPA